MKIPILAIVCCLASASALQAQTPDSSKPMNPAVRETLSAADTTRWTLDDCIRYAQQNNIAVQQRAVSVQENEVQLSTAKYSRLPNLNARIGGDASFGLSPTNNNVYVNSNNMSGSLGVSTSIPIFEGLRINKRIAGSKFDLAAAVQDLERIREDVAVNVMSLYLQVLFCKELCVVAEQQLALSEQQTRRSRELVASGKQPESALYESEALRAKDYLNLTQARNDLKLALLDLSQALNRESATGFDVEEPLLDTLSLAVMHRLGSPDAVYDYAEQHRPHIRAEQLRRESRETAIGIAKAALYPSLSLDAGYSTSVYDKQESVWDQFHHNSREYIGLSLNIPIFNRRATRNDIRSARLSLRNQELALTEARQSLRKEIEQAWYNANAAYEKYRSADAALASARVAFAYEQRKAESGRSTVFDFNDAKTRMQKAESELIQAKFEFVFRSKILDYYRGEPLRL